MTTGRPERALLLGAALALAASGCSREQPQRRGSVDVDAAAPPPSGSGRSAEGPPSPDGGAGPVDLDPIPEAERRAIPGWISFLSERDGNREAYLLRPSGEEERRLTRTPTDEYPAASSPDGAALLLIAVEDDADRKLHLEQVVVQPLDGGPSTSVGPRGGRDRSPGWSPDGRWIVFESDRESFSDIYRVGRDGGALTRLTRNAEGNFEPALSPDGTQIAFVSSRDGDPELYRMRADGTHQERLTAFHSEDWGPRWSPDGKQLAFLSDRGGRARIHVINADGTHLKTLAGPPPEAAGRRLPAPGPPAPGPPAASEEQSDPAWSPDGTRLAYVARGPGAKARLWVADLATGRALPLTDGAHVDEAAAWSPDGRYLAFTSDRAGDTDLYLMRANGTGQTRLTRAKGADWLPRWVPPARQAAPKPR